ncbi:MAG: helix-turn-helix transcriptional regulator [Phycisphaerales bacterium]|nr:helix-turn-helix transcriptional regulator [Phycisphaerales bacterium]
MPEILSSREVFRGGSAAVYDVRCSARRCGCSGEEHNAGDSIAFIRSGVFVKHTRGTRIVADPTSAVFFTRGETYRVSHPGDHGDRCTSFALPAGLLWEALREFDPRAAERPDGPFPLTHAPADEVSFLLQARLLEHLRRSDASPLAVEEAACGLARRLVRSACEARLSGPSRGAGGSPGPRGDTTAAHRDLVEACKVALAARAPSRLTLIALAREVHASPYHLSRVFRAGTGLTLQRYANRLRLRDGLRRLLDDRGEPAVVAVECGFFDQSHFCNAFKREFGVTPGRGAQGHLLPFPRALAHLSKLLQD